MRSLELERYGVQWIYPSAAVAHPLDNAAVVTLERSIDDTVSQLGSDGPAYRRLFGPLAQDWQNILADLLGPLPFPPRHPFSLLRFALPALAPAAGLARFLFRQQLTRGAFAGLAAHSLMPLEWPATGAFGLILGLLAHALGWPLARGGSQTIANAMGAIFTSLGGNISTGINVNSMKELPTASAYLFDVTPRQLLQIAGDRLPPAYCKALGRYRYGPGVFKIDYALSDPVPWKNPACSRAATVHLGGSLDEIAASERSPARGEHPAAPFVLFVQHSLFDDTRAPQGMHTAWAYCHVPAGSSRDMTGPIETQIERFAPGFKDLMLFRSTRNAVDMETYNPNYIGGDINGGMQDLFQLYTRPVARFSPYTTPARDIFICSSSTPPGGGVHGMCGYHAALAALPVIDRSKLIAG